MKTMHKVLSILGNTQPVFCQVEVDMYM